MLLLQNVQHCDWIWFTFWKEREKICLCSTQQRFADIQKVSCSSRGEIEAIVCVFSVPKYHQTCTLQFDLVVFVFGEIRRRERQVIGMNRLALWHAMLFPSSSDNGPPRSSLWHHEGHQSSPPGCLESPTHVHSIRKHTSLSIHWPHTTQTSIPSTWF